MNYQHQHFRVGLAVPGSFITSYGWTNDTEASACPVLHCQFDLPSTGTVDAYAKVIDVTTQQGVIMCLNEISGWLLARAGGLPVAESAFLAYIRTDELPAFAYGTLPAEQAGGVRLFFCTQAISRAQATGLVRTEALIAEQTQWPHMHGTLALDEYTGNSDRHTGNMVRKSAGEFVLIDHGRLLFRNPAEPGAPKAHDPCWEVSELTNLLEHAFKNILHHNIYLYGNISSAAARTDAFKKCAESALEQAQNMRSVFFEIAYWCSKLSPGASAQWLEFLNERMSRINDLLSKRFGLLNLI
jgi:hypothetical protein